MLKLVEMPMLMLIIKMLTLMLINANNANKMLILMLCRVPTHPRTVAQRFESPVLAPPPPAPKEVCFAMGLWVHIFQ